MHQGEEVLAFGQPVEREARVDAAVRLLLGDHVAQQVEVAVQLGPRRLPVHHQQVAQPGVVDADVLVDADGGEVEEHHHVAAAPGGGVAADVGTGEDPLEEFLLGAVVVALQEREPAALAEAAGTDEEDVALVLDREPAGGGRASESRCMP